MKKYIFHPMFVVVLLAMLLYACGWRDGKDCRQLAESLTGNGTMMFEAGDMEGSVKEYLAALDALSSLDSRADGQRSEIYSLLGNAYFHASLYDDAKEAYTNAFSTADEREKVVALHGVAKCMAMMGQADSAAVTMRSALSAATALNDSALMLKSIYDMGVMYERLDRFDSARYYMELSQPYLERMNINKGGYYAGLGLFYLNLKDTERANDFIEKSLREELDSLQKLTAYNNMFDVKRLRGEYAEACGYAATALDMADSLYNADKSTEIERLAYNYKTKLRLHEEKRHEQMVLMMVIGFAIVVCAAIIVLYQRRLYERRRKHLLSEQALKEAKMKIEGLRMEIADNRSIISLLKDEHTGMEQERQAHADMVKSREETIERLKEEAVQLRGWMLSQTDIFRKVQELSAQKVDSKREARVLNGKEQTLLQNTVFDIYSDYISEMRSAHPKLTDADLLYLCLQTTDLTTFGLAICFGNPDSQVVRQRKLRLKAKMS
jgi:tetratricopeptide (TPR) repeat protein